MVIPSKDFAQPTLDTINSHISCARLSKESQANWLSEIVGLNFPLKDDQASWYEFQERAFQATKANITSEIRQLLQRLSLPNGSDVIVIEGLPYQDPGPPPTDGQRPAGKPAVSEAVLVGLVTAAGLKVFGYLQEKKGSLIHQVAPEIGKENTQSNSGRTLFGYHVDNTCFSERFQPEFLFLIGLVNEGSIATRLLRLEEDILPHIQGPLLNSLRKPIFRFAAPQSFDLGGFVLASPLRPVIHEDASGMQHISWPSRRYVQDTQEAETAMREFQSLLDTLTPCSVVVQPGSLLAFRNSRVLHGREPIPVNARRWLQRVYTSRSLAAHRQAANSSAKTQVFDARLLAMA